MKNILTLLIILFTASLAQAADISSSNYSTLDSSNNLNSPNGYNSTTTPANVIAIQQQNFGAQKRWWERSGPVITAGGTANALTYTPSNVLYPNAYVQGDSYSFIASATNTGATTINVNGLGAVNINKIGGSGPTPLVGGEIQVGQVVIIDYDGSNFNIVSPIATSSGGGTGSGTVNSGAANQLGYYSSTGTAISGTNALPNGTTATTQPSGSNNVNVATTAYVDGTFAPLASPSFTGSPSLPSGTTGVTQSTSDNSTRIATTAYVKAQSTSGFTSCTLSISSAGGTTETSSCSAGYTMTGGGCGTNSGTAYIIASGPQSSSQWVCKYSSSSTITATAICCH